VRPPVPGSTSAGACCAPWARPRTVIFREPVAQPPARLQEPRGLPGAEALGTATSTCTLLFSDQPRTLGRAFVLFIYAFVLFISDLQLQPLAS
jgi:hypothetical protein